MTINVILLSFFFLSTQDIKAQKNVFSEQYPLLIKQSGKFGYLNRISKTIIPPTYQQADLFSDGLAPVRVKGKWGYINVDGKLIILPQFDEAFGFIGGVAIVYKKGGNMLINKKGKVILDLNKYENQVSFSENYAAVNDGGKWNFVDSTGKIWRDIPYDDAYNFSNGLARVKQQGKWRYIDYNGKTVLTTNFEEVYDFSDGMAVVYSDGKKGAINNKGELVIPLHYYGIEKFKTGIASYQLVSNGEWGYISKEGKILTEPVFTQARNFSEGFAAVKMNGKWGYIKSSLDTLTSLSFDEAYPFSDERAFIKIGNKYGVIDNTGKIILEPVYDDFNLNGFKHGVAMVYMGGMEEDFFTVGNTTVKMGYIDKNGSYIWPPSN